MDSEVVSRCDSYAVSKSACELVIQDGTRRADVGAELVVEPGLGSNGYADSVQRVRNDATLIKRQQT